MEIKRSVIRIGTSGIVLPGSKATFPDKFRTRSRLHFYGSLFNTLELNSSFYKVPLPQTFARWASEVPDDFKFTVKLWRGITHAKNLEYTLGDIDIFLTSANALEKKAGCLLIQFPASITFNFHRQVEQILLRVQQLDKNNRWQLAVELRHASWYQEAAYSIFKNFGAAVVVHDMPNSKTPPGSPAADIIYFRFHGPTGNYRGSYSEEFIGECASRIKNFTQAGAEVYVYFNNTIGSALVNAQLLQQLTQ